MGLLQKRGAERSNPRGRENESQFTGGNPQQAYEAVFEVNAEGGVQPGQADCEMLVDWTLDLGPGQRAAFESSRREIFELRKKNAEGFASSRLRRSVGIPNRYLVIGIYANREAAMNAGLNPKTAAFAAAHPYTDYTSTRPSAEAYSVIHRM